MFAVKEMKPAGGSLSSSSVRLEKLERPVEANGGHPEKAESST